MRESGKIFIACFIGAGIGSFVALEVAHTLWWLGFVVGGLTGYLSYEWRRVAHAIPEAYRAAGGLQGFSKFFLFLGEITAMLATMIFWMAVVPFIMVISTTQEPQVQQSVQKGDTAILFTVFAIVYVAMVAMLTLAYTKKEKDLRRDLFLYFPALVIFWHLPCGLFWAIRKCPKFPRIAASGAIAFGKGLLIFASFCGRFGRELFIRIHSDVRLLCGLDAAIGSAVGYFAGSAIIGATAGGLIGLLNYEILSIRILRLIRN